MYVLLVRLLIWRNKRRRSERSASVHGGRSHPHWVQHQSWSSRDPRRPVSWSFSRHSCQIYWLWQSDCRLCMWFQTDRLNYQLVAVAFAASSTILLYPRTARRFYVDLNILELNLSAELSRYRVYVDLRCRQRVGCIFGFDLKHSVLDSMFLTVCPVSCPTTTSPEFSPVWSETTAFSPAFSRILLSFASSTVMVVVVDPFVVSVDDSAASCFSPLTTTTTLFDGVDGVDGVTGWTGGSIIGSSAATVTVTVYICVEPSSAVTVYKQDLWSSASLLC